MTLLSEFADQLGVTTQRAYQLLQPEKHRARRNFNKALARGSITKPDSCEKCGSQQKLHAHHEDYTKFYSVIWVCKSCHVVVHPVVGAKGSLTTEEMQKRIDTYWIRKTQNQIGRRGKSLKIS